MMHRIYAHATQAVVWLGDAAYDTQLAFDFARGVAAIISPDGSRAFPTPESFGPFIQEGRLIKPAYILHWLALHSIINRPWWRRAWIVEEVLLAKTAIFMCGDAVVSYNDLRHSIYAASVLKGELQPLLEDFIQFGLPIMQRQHPHIEFRTRLSTVENSQAAMYLSEVATSTNTTTLGTLRPIC